MVFPATANVKDLQREHPEFALFKDAYASIDLLYHGGVQILDAVVRAGMFLEKAPKELPEVYTIRQKRFSYKNLLANVIGWYQAALFKIAPDLMKTPEGAAPDQPVELSQDVADFCAAFEENADRGGSSLVCMMQDAAEKLLLYRKAFVLLDLPTPDADDPRPVNLKQQQNAGLLDPYLVLYSPRHVINWETDEYGNLEWLLIYLRTEEQEFLAQPKITDRWYFFDREECALYEREVKSGAAPPQPESPTQPSTPLSGMEETATLAPGYPRKHALSDQMRVPVRVIDLPKGLWLANRVYLPLVNHLNQDNALDFGLFQANLPQLVIEDGTNGTYEEPVTISPVGYHKIPNGGDMRYLEPEGRAYEAAQKRLDSLEEGIYKTCYLIDQARTNRSTPTAQSGISKQQDKIPSQDAMSGMGDVLRPAFQMIYQDVLDVRGFSDIKVDIRGFDFADKNTAQDLDLLEKSTVIDVNSVTYEREIGKKTVRAVLSDANPQTLAAIDKEIDQNPTPSQVQQQQQEEQRAAMLQKFSAAFPQASQVTQ